MANKFDSQWVWQEGYDNGLLCAQLDKEEDPVYSKPPDRDWLNGMSQEVQDLAKDDEEQLDLIETEFIKGCQAGYKKGYE